jgi:hypothetical protein
VPSRKEIQWSQLRVGALVLAAMAVLIGLILLMSGSSGGLFARKLVLRSYFENAAGLKDGAPVTLEGVTIGNVIHVRVVPERNPTPVEVTMRVGHEYLTAAYRFDRLDQPGRRSGRQLRRYQLGPRQRTRSGQQCRTEGLRLAQHSGCDPHQQRIHRRRSTS